LRIVDIIIMCDNGDINAPILC